MIPESFNISPAVLGTVIFPGVGASLIAMQSPIKERIAKLREEIAQISEANRLYMLGGKNKLGATGDHSRRLQRLQEILDELVALTDWKKL